MDRSGLEQHDHATLIEIILRQQEMIERLRAEVAELKAKAGQPPKTPGNSSVPPSMGFKLNRAGRRAGSDVVVTMGSVGDGRPPM
jgi:hypothetical protein